MVAQLTNPNILQKKKKKKKKKKQESTTKIKKKKKKKKKIKIKRIPSINRITPQLISLLLT